MAEIVVTMSQDEYEAYKAILSKVDMLEDYVNNHEEDFLQGVIASGNDEEMLFGSAAVLTSSVRNIMGWETPEEIRRLQKKIRILREKYIEGEE